ncbi:MAG: TetR/AcrR family transcriptional regulator [Actinobacteria bacterium]|nr:MAG: TetR/AcrR family transcriptional regulator [Actinomycetota bacterium]
MATMAFDLPVTQPGGDAQERADAARNRRKILEAAQALFAERGVEHVSMDDVARAACVGKGTLYRRFGDRASLAYALLDERERVLQEAIIRGEPPLGPGAEAADRLCAFGDAMLDHLEQHYELLWEAERGHHFDLGPYAFRRTHLALLLREANPGCDAEIAAEALLALLSPTLFRHLRLERGFGLDRVKAGWHSAVAGWVGADYPARGNAT